MSSDELEAEALKLDPRSRARLAGKLLDSLEQSTGDEIEATWAEEAERRNAELDTDPGAGIPAEEALRDARSRLK